MAHWLIKSEPGTWSWDDQLRDQITFWDGVRNYQASNNLKAMKIGDECFFYHSGKNREIVGIVKVVKEYYPDHTDKTGRFGMVDVGAVRTLDRPVTLAEIKAEPGLSEILLVRHSRLSVMPIDDDSWKLILRMAGG